MENSVEAIMSKKLETIDIIDTAQNAAQTMKERKISSLIVVDMKNKPNEPLGIVTEKDFVHKICTQGSSSKDIAIGEIIPPRSLQPPRMPPLKGLPVLC